MAGLTQAASGANVFGMKAGSNSGKSGPASSAGSSPLCPECGNSEVKDLIFVRYIDHVIFNRTSAVAMKPQIREAVGWLVYKCSDYLTLSWDRDAEPPTLRGGDPKASGLVLLRTDILEFKKLVVCRLLQENSECVLNSSAHIVKDEFALQPKERKTHGAKDSTRKEKL